MSSLKVEVTEISQVGEARRLAVSLAQSLGFSEIEASKAAIAASEMASNLARYAEHGEIILRSLDDEYKRGLELLAVDKGPGISDVAESMRDGFSTSGSAGIGLGGIARQSDLFDVYTIPRQGTVLLSQLWSGLSDANQTGSLAQTGVVCLPAAGQIISGDAWAMQWQGKTRRYMIVDGLGHGEKAGEAAQSAIRLFYNHPGASLSEFVELAHSALKSTRGAVMAVAEVNPDEHVVRFCGVGNIYGMICSEGQSHGLVSYEGIVGHNATRFREFSYPYPAESHSLLVLHSDGLGTRWDLNLYPGLLRRHPSLVAGILYRDFKRPNDDVTVLVSRLE